MDVIRDTSFGGSLGTALGQGLQALAQGKIQQMQQQKIASGIQSLMGVSPRDALAMASLPESTLNTVLKSKLQQQANIPFAQALSSIMGEGAAMQPQETETPTPEQEIPSTSPEANITPLAAGQQSEQRPGVPKKSAEQQSVMPKKPEISGVNAQQAFQLAQLKTQREKNAWKVNEKYLNTLSEKKDAADEGMMAVDRIIELNNKGDLIDPKVYGVLHKYGWDLDALFNGDSTELQKLSTVFYKGFKSIIGGRITGKEFEMLSKGIPTLAQTKEGRDAVLRNLKYMFQIDQLKSDTANQIIEQKGQPPLNLKALVDKKIKPQVEEIKNKFIAGISELPTGSQVDELPPAWKYPGKEFLDNKTGKKLVSDGKHWR